MPNSSACGGKKQCAQCPKAVDNAIIYASHLRGFHLPARKCEENIINFKADFYPGRHRSFTGMPHNYLFMERENIDEAIAPVYGASIGVMTGIIDDSCSCL